MRKKYEEKVRIEWEKSKNTIKREEKSAEKVGGRKRRNMNRLKKRGERKMESKKGAKKKTKKNEESRESVKDRKREEKRNMVKERGKEAKREDKGRMRERDTLWGSKPSEMTKIRERGGSKN